MDSRMSDVDYDRLDRLLGALSESVAGRVHLDGAALSESPLTPETLPAAWQDTATAVQVDTLPRGVALRTVSRGVLGQFLPAAFAVTVTLVCINFLINPLDFSLMRVPFGVLLISTLGFAVGLGALSPWLYPHSNADGRRSEVAGFVSPFWFLIVAVGLDSWVLPAPPLAALFLWLLPGMSLAVIAYAPWLRRTSRIAPASPPGRWRTLRAIAVTGGLGAFMFGSAGIIRLLLTPLPAGLDLGTPFYHRLAFGTSFGFLIGVAFALALAVVYRRYTLEELRAWKVGLWAAAAAALPALVFMSHRAVNGLTLFQDPLAELMSVLFESNLPGFVMGYAAVKLAQRSRPAE